MIVASLPIRSIWSATANVEQPVQLPYASAKFAGCALGPGMRFTRTWPRARSVPSLWLTTRTMLCGPPPPGATIRPIGVGEAVAAGAAVPVAVVAAVAGAAAVVGAVVALGAAAVSVGAAAAVAVGVGAAVVATTVPTGVAAIWAFAAAATGWAEPSSRT